MTTERLAPVPPSDWSPEQRAAAEFFQSTRGAPLSGPFAMLIRNPEAMRRVAAMGDYFRYRTVLGPRLSEFAILLVAREWTQDYEWHTHCPIALKAGVSREATEAIRGGRRPDVLTEDETTVYEFCAELLRTRRVSDAIYGRALARFGETGVIDLTGVVGYYSFLAMQMNVARTAIPADGQRLPRFPE